MDTVQILRLLANTSINERLHTSDLVEKTGLLSVNQLAASIKILEAWKSLNINNFPIHLEPNNKCSSNGDRQVRPSTSRLRNQDARTNAARESFSRNAAKIWNGAPNDIKNVKSLNLAKKAIKSYCKTLPI